MEVPGKTTSQDISKSLLHGSEDDIKLYCQPCDRDGPRVQAYGYCQDCAEHLCETCFKSHRKPAPCRNHVLLDKTQMPKSKSHSQHKIPNDLTEQCQQHPGKVIEYFCHDHNVLGCSPCITISHRNCKVDYIPDVSAKYLTSTQYQQLRNSMKILKDNLQKIISHAKANGKTVIENKATINYEIKKFRQEINMMFDELEAQLQQQSDDVFAEESTRIDSLAIRSVKMLKDIESLQDDINKLEKAGKYNALYIKVKENEVSMKTCTSAMEEMRDKNSVNTYQFEPDKTFKNMLRSDSRMGELLPQRGITSPLPALTKQEDLPRDLQQEPSTVVVSRKGELYDKLIAMPAGEINLRMTSDKTDGCIGGVVVICKDTVAAKDSINKTVKLVDTNHMKVVSTKSLSSSPAGLEVLPGGQLAVVFTEEQMILFLSIPNGLSEVHSLKVAGKCRDIAYCDGKLVVTFQYPGKVQIMDKKGRIFNTLCKDFFGKTFKTTMVTVDRNNKFIYISDYRLQTITCFNWEGRLINGYKVESLENPCGLATLEDGSLLVCSSGNNRIHLISQKLRKGRVILEEKDGLNCPWSVALDTEKNMIFVGSGTTGNFLKRFSLLSLQ